MLLSDACCSATHVALSDACCAQRMLRWFPLPWPNFPPVACSSPCCRVKASSPGESKLPSQEGASVQGACGRAGEAGQGAVRGAHRQQAGSDGEDGPEGQHPARRLDGAVRPLA